MTRRRESRRRHREERRERSDSGDASVVTAPSRTPADSRDSPAGISVMGVVGGLSGLLPMAAIAASILIDPGDASRWYAIVFAIGALFFVPVTWASYFPTSRRVQVQKGAVFGCLAIAAVTSILLSTLVIAVLLAIPTTLLAIASGIVFQGRRET